LSSIVYSCVVEPQPKFLHQLSIWATTLIELAGVRADDLFVHVVGGDYAADVADYAAARGIPHAEVARFGDGRYCNKLRQLRSAPLRRYPFVALCDTDLAFCEALEPHRAGRVAAKIVDLPNPPLELLEGLYRRAGFSNFPELARCTNADAWTFANNCNGGLYQIDAEFLRELAPRWEKWALWVLEQRELQGAYAVHADQLGFGLAMWELGENVAPLPTAKNFPTHLPPDSYAADGTAPAILHYHDRLAPDGMLLPLGVPRADERVRLVNDVLSAERRASFDNARFWNFRYREHAALGSGLGSRGRAADEKRRLIASVIAVTSPGSVLDVGCGDLFVTGELPIAAYVGLDVSAEAIRIARARRADWHFITGDVLSAALDPADVVLCFDVLIHERDAHRYRAAVSRLAALAKHTLVVAAYNQEPWLTSAMTFYHEPISRTLRESGAFESLEIIGGYRDTTVLRAERRAEPDAV